MKKNQKEGLLTWSESSNPGYGATATDTESIEPPASPSPSNSSTFVTSPAMSPVKQQQSLRASKPPKSILLNVCSFILVTEFCERLAYYGLVSSLPVLFTTRFHMSNLLTTELNSLFSAMAYLTPLVGAYVADVLHGRFKTIGLFCMIYVIGLGLCTLSVWPSLQSSLQPLFFIGLFMFVVVGSGGIKPNVVVLGADQFHDYLHIPEIQKEKDSFFRWFYWAVNLGATFSHLYLSNLAINGSEPTIPVNYGYFACYAIIFTAFTLAMITFFAGSKRYKKLQPSGTVVFRAFEIFWVAGRQSRTGKLILGSTVMLLPAVIILIISYFIPKSASTIVSGVGMTMVCVSIVVLITFAQTTNWLVVARQSLGGKYKGHEVGELADVVRLLPYFGFMISFWANYGQMQTNFIMQGCQMDTRISSDTNYQLNASALSAFDSLVILLMIPVFEKVIFPLLERRGMRLTTLQKIGGGFVFSALAMVASAVVEVMRKDSKLIEYSYLSMPDQDRVLSSCNPGNFRNATVIACSSQMVDDDCHCIEVGGMSYLSGCTGQPMSELSVFYQVFQYMLIGVSEILTSTSSNELFYNQVPPTMRSVCQALNLLTTSLGVMVTGGTNALFSFWVADNLNNGHLENIFVLLGVGMTINVLAFTVVSKTFRYVALPTSKRFSRFPITPNASSTQPQDIPQPNDSQVIVSPTDNAQESVSLTSDEISADDFVSGFTPVINHHPAHKPPSYMKI